MSSLGNGKTSRVYLCRSLVEPDTKVAVKLFREEYLAKDPTNQKTVENEIELLKDLNHHGVVRTHGSGMNGTVKKPSGKVMEDLRYIVLEYAQAGTLFDLCETHGPLGEDIGRFFLHQMVDVLSYVHSKKIVHRDLKLENILLDDKMNLKIADFGFSRYQTNGLLQTTRGTVTYMAPEIKEGRPYDGRQADVFSVGVILFILVLGIFPFQEARKEEYFYGQLLKGRHANYWSKVGGDALSDDFKDLMQKLFSFSGEDRPTLEAIMQHPWMTSPSFHMGKTRVALLQKVQQARQDASTDSTSD